MVLPIYKWPACEISVVGVKRFGSSIWYSKLEGNESEPFTFTLDER